MSKVWQADWIIDQDFEGLKPLDLFHKETAPIDEIEHDPDLKNRHMLVRKKFNLQQNWQEAFLDITADDYYKVYINGQFVGQGPAPAYDYNYYYNRYDISGYLQEGENVIAVHVYYQGLVNRVWNSGDYRQGMIAELLVDDQVEVHTDSTWKYKQALEFSGKRIFAYDTQYSEDIDQRLKEKHWQELHYDDQVWRNVSVHQKADYKLVLQPTANLEVYEIQPKKVDKLNEDHYIIDFGQEITGQFVVEANGAAGQTVEVMCGEELKEDSKHVRHELRCNCDYKETWTLSDGNDTLEHFDYKGFRYVEIIAPKDTIVAESFRAIVRHYPFNEQQHHFSSSNNLLNDIWQICKNGVKYGTQEVYVDCPTREKGQYLGDVTVIAHAHLYLTGELDMFKKSLEEFALSTDICPGMMAVAPGNFRQEIADYSLQWPYQLLTYYQQSGDIEFLKKMYPVAEGIINYFKKYQRADGLLESVKEKWNLVDWPENLRDNYDFNLSRPVADGCHNVINAFYCGAISTLNDIRDILTIDYDGSEFERVKKSYIDTFYDQEKRLFVDAIGSEHSSLHANVQPLFWGLVPQEAEESVVELIRGKRLSCGVYNSYFLLKGLASVGAFDLVYELITSEDKQSWANMIREGATTCFEAWGKDQKWNTSLCHPWASSPIPVLIEDVIGIKPLSPGWEKVQFNPNIPQSLDHITVQIETIKGTIKVEYKNGKAEIEVPSGCTLV